MTLVLLLASASPARRRLLEQAAIPHRVQVSGVDEDAITDPNPAQLVQLLAQAKARAVWEAQGPAELQELGVTALLGCDSVLAFEGEVFGKPADAEEAIARWRRMAGGWGSCTPAIACCPWRVNWSASPQSPHECSSLPSAMLKSPPMWPPVNRCTVQAVLRLKGAAVR